MRKPAQLALAAALLGCGAVGCDVTKGEYFGRIEARGDTKVLYYGNSAEPEFMDPARLTAVNDGKVADQAFDGLTELHPQTARPIPSIAERWDASADSLDFTFYIRDTAKFSDGRKLDATDVVYSWGRMLHPLWAARDAEEAYKIEGGEEYNSGVLRELLRPIGPLAPGRVVIVDQVWPKLSAAVIERRGIDNTNLRRAKSKVAVHADPDQASPVYHHFTSDQDLIVFDVSADRSWVHVWEDLNLKGGWVRADQLSSPNDERVYLIEGFDKGQRNKRTFAKGKDLLMHPGLIAFKSEDGGKKLTVHLAKPTLFWLLQVANSTFRIVDRHSIDRLGKAWHRAAGKFACSGAFCLKEWHLRNKLVLDKNPNYWDREHVKLERLVMMSIDNQSAAVNLYFDGRVDMLTANSIPGSILPKVNGALGGPAKKDFHRQPWLGVYYYVINVHKDKGPPALKNRHLRRALSLALDREQLPGILRSGALPWAAAVPDMKDVIGYSPPRGLWFDLAAAKQELDAAKKELGSIPSLTIRINTGVEAHQIIAEWVQDQWKTQLGLDITIESQEWGTMLKALREHDFQIMRMGGIASMPEPEDFIGDSYRKGSPNNKPGWDSDEYMQLLNQMQLESDREKRNALILAMENMVLEEAVIIPLTAYVQNHLSKPYVCNVPHNILDQTALKYVWIDFTEKCEGASDPIARNP